MRFSNPNALSGTSPFSTTPLIGVVGLAGAMGTAAESEDGKTSSIIVGTTATTNLGPNTGSRICGGLCGKGTGKQMARTSSDASISEESGAVPEDDLEELSGGGTALPGCVSALNAIPPGSVILGKYIQHGVPISNHNLGTNPYINPTSTSGPTTLPLDVRKSTTVSSVAQASNVSPKKKRRIICDSSVASSNNFSDETNHRMSFSLSSQYGCTLGTTVYPTGGKKKKMNTFEFDSVGVGDDDSRMSSLNDDDLNPVIARAGLTTAIASNKTTIHHSESSVFETDTASRNSYHSSSTTTASGALQYPTPIISSYPRPRTKFIPTPKYAFRPGNGPLFRDSIITYENMRDDSSLLDDPLTSGGITSLLSFSKRSKGILWHNRTSIKLHYENFLNVK